MEKETDSKCSGNDDRQLRLSDEDGGPPDSAAANPVKTLDTLQPGLPKRSLRSRTRVQPATFGGEQVLVAGELLEALRSEREPG